MQKIAIIVPCYNERKRLNAEAFKAFVQQHEDVFIIFVDDGSKDETAEVLHSIRTFHPDRVQVMSIEKNKGKANAVLAGMRMAVSEKSFAYIGYLDADLSTSPLEFYRLFEKMTTKDLDYILGSRIKLLQSSIRRSFLRHLSGRFIATIIDWKYSLGIYDTQCGAKIFKAPMVESLTATEFKTKWFFDVELFLRMRERFPRANGMEVPLSSWTDPGNSKLNWVHFPLVISELFTLMNNYSNKPAKPLANR